MCIRRTLVGNTFKHRGHSLNRDKIAYFHKKCRQFLTGGGGSFAVRLPHKGFCSWTPLGARPLHIPIPASHFKWPSAAYEETCPWRDGFVKQVGLREYKGDELTWRAANPRENCDLSCAKWGDHQKDNWNEPGETNHGVLPILLKLKSVYSRPRKVGVQRITVVKRGVNSGSGAGTGCLGRSRTAMIIALRPWFHVKI